MPRVSTDIDIARNDFRGAARAANNLSALLQSRGELRDAVATARQSVELADKSKDAFQRMSKRTTLAAGLHAMGLREDAATLFAEAERMQKEMQPEYPLLYSIQGFRYCDLLLDQGRAADVRERAAQTLQWVMAANIDILSIALNHLSLGRAHLVGIKRDTRGDMDQATSHLERAVDGLRNAGQQDYLPLGILARAALHIHNRDFADARTDLDEAMDLATNCGFRLHEVDAFLGYTRLAITQEQPTEAREHLDAARKIITDTEYHRRDAEVLELETALAPIEAAATPARSRKS